MLDKDYDREAREALMVKDCSSDSSSSDDSSLSVLLRSD